MKPVGSFFFGFFLAVFVGMIATTGLIEWNRYWTWNKAYCSALGGEIISDDVCVKNSVVIPIPERD